MGRRWKKHRIKRKATLSHADAAWDVRFQELKQYRREYGHLHVPSCSKDHPSLGNWVNHQRLMYRSGRMLSDRRDRLEKVGFDWISRGRSVEFRDSGYWDDKWERMYRKLVQFHKRFEHCVVPSSWGGYPRLSEWVKRQRHLQEEGTLSKERWRRLKALGLATKKPGSLDPRWERSFVRLMEYKRQYGNCRVPAESKEHFKLGQWCVKMRRHKRNGVMSAEKRRRLDEVGFVWDPTAAREAEHDVLWLKWMTKLQAFRDKRGHWRVPTDQPRFHQLRVWMDNQRISYTRGWLPAERIKRLNALEFPWMSDRQRLAAESEES